MHHSKGQGSWVQALARNYSTSSSPNDDIFLLSIDKLERGKSEKLVHLKNLPHSCIYIACLNTLNAIALIQPDGHTNDENF